MFIIHTTRYILYGLIPGITCFHYLHLSSFSFFSCLRFFFSCLLSFYFPALQFVWIVQKKKNCLDCTRTSTYNKLVVHIVPSTWLFMSFPARLFILALLVSLCFLPCSTPETITMYVQEKEKEKIRKNKKKQQGQKLVELNKDTAAVVHRNARQKRKTKHDTKTTDRDSLRYTYNGTRRVRQLALGCESS